MASSKKKQKQLVLNLDDKSDEDRMLEKILNEQFKACPTCKGLGKVKFYNSWKICANMNCSNGYLK